MSIRSLSFKLTVLAAAVAAAPGAGAIDLRPRSVAVQSGGGMGAVSAGAGWIYGAKDRFETELFVGYIPRYDSSAAKVSLALKENFVPWSLHLKGNVYLRPLTASFYLTTVISKKFWVKQPDRYEKGYYVLPTKVRLNLSLGQRLEWHIPGPPAPPRKRRPRAISLYYELGTCDIYFLSALSNSYLRPSDWLQLTLGARLTL